MTGSSLLVFQHLWLILSVLLYLNHYFQEHPLSTVYSTHALGETVHDYLLVFCVYLAFRDKLCRKFRRSIFIERFTFNPVNNSYNPHQSSLTTSSPKDTTRSLEKSPL